MLDKYKITLAHREKQILAHINHKIKCQNVHLWNKSQFTRFWCVFKVSLSQVQSLHGARNSAGLGNTLSGVRGSSEGTGCHGSGRGGRGRGIGNDWPFTHRVRQGRGRVHGHKVTSISTDTAARLVVVDDQRTWGVSMGADRRLPGPGLLTIQFSHYLLTWGQWRQQFHSMSSVIVLLMQGLCIIIINLNSFLIRPTWL